MPKTRVHSTLRKVPARSQPTLTTQELQFYSWSRELMISLVCVAQLPNKCVVWACDDVHSQCSTSCLLIVVIAQKSHTRKLWSCPILVAADLDPTCLDPPDLGIVFQKVTCPAVSVGIKEGNRASALLRASSYASMEADIGGKGACAWVTERSSCVRNCKHVAY